MIYYNSNTINDWNFGDDNIIKVYRNNAIVFYKFDSETQEFKVCYAVVDDISQYSETEFEDVYDKATEKWYKLNNLNQYEQYGIYGSGRTSCEGSTSRLPQGYTEVEYIENTGTSYINTNLQLCSATTNTFQVEAKLVANRIGSDTYQNIFACMSEAGEPYQGFTYRFQGTTITPAFIPSNDGSFTQVTNEDSTISVTASSINGLTYSHTYPLTICCGLNSSRNPFRYTNTKVYTFKVTLNNNVVADYVPAMRDSDSKYGLYDLITDTFYTSPNGNNFSGGEPITPTDCVTTYEGKLTVDDGYEYMYSGGSWVNVGEVSGSSRVPQGYTEVEYVENTSSAYINTNLVLLENIGDSFEIKVKTYFTPYGRDFEYLFGTEQTSAPYAGIQLRYYQRNLQFISDSNVVWTHIDNGDGTSGVTASCSSINATNGGNPLTLFCGLWSTGPWRFGRGKIYSFTVTKNDTLVRDLVPCKRDSDNMVGVYDLANDVFYYPPNYSSYQLIAGAETGSTVYPMYYDEKSEPLDNLTFNTMEDAVDYAYNNCVYDGMHAIIDGDRYYFDSTDENGWVENQHSLPDVPFTVNYNAKQYNASTKTLLKTEGQLADVDAIITAGTPTVHDSYLTIASSTRATISGYQNYFNRDNNNPNLTIISKQRTDGNNCHMFANRDSNYNWMYRCYSSKLTLHGTSEQGSVAVTTQPVIESVRINSSRLATYNNYTNGTSTTHSNFDYGSTNSTATALFAGYAYNTGEWFAGDFYWVYMCQGTLTDEQVQQVIDYNENL